MSSAHRYLDVLERVAQAHANAKSAQSAKSGPRTNAEAAQNSQNAQNSHAQGPASKRGSEQNPYGSTIVTLEARCPDFVPADRWQQAVSNGKTFLSCSRGPYRRSGPCRRCETARPCWCCCQRHKQRS